MKKVSRFLIMCVLILSQFSSIAFAGNWPNMKTGTSSNSTSKTGSSGGSFTISCKNTRTLYTVEQLEGGNMKTFEVKDSTGICGNTVTWFRWKSSKGKINWVGAVENPKITVGEQLFKELLNKESLKPSDVIKEGKSKFRITAEIQLLYNGSEYYTYRKASQEGMINKR